MKPISNNKEESLRKIAKHVYEWYREWVRENVEPEAEVMKTVDLAKLEGRFELLILARLFNNPLREETAIRYFQKLKEWFYGKGYSYRVENKAVGKIDIEVVRNEDHRSHLEFRNLVLTEFAEMDLGTRNKNLNGFIMCAQAFHERDLIEYINEIQDNKDLIDAICEKLRSAGIYVKSFLVVREMNKAGLWKIDRQNLWMCCVPDSKVRGFLNERGFVPESVCIEKGQIQYSPSQLKEYSKIIWKYFNEPFGESHFDLPIFRYIKKTDELSPEEFERLQG